MYSKEHSCNLGKRNLIPAERWSRKGIFSTPAMSGRGAFLSQKGFHNLLYGAIIWGYGGRKMNRNETSYLLLIHAMHEPMKGIYFVVTSEEMRDKIIKKYPEYEVYDCNSQSNDLVGWIKESITGNCIICNPKVDEVNLLKDITLLENKSIFVFIAPSEADMISFDDEEDAIVRGIYTLSKKDMLREGKNANRIGNKYYDKDDYANALKMYLDAVEICELTMGETNVETAKRYINTANAFHALGDGQKALEYSEKAKDIFEIKLGNDAYDTSVSYRAMGLAYYSLGNAKLALRCLKKSLTIQKRLLPRGDIEIGRRHVEVASAYALKNDYGNAGIFFSRGLSILREKLREDDPEIIDSYISAGDCCLNDGLNNKAKDCYEIALAGKEKQYGPEHPEVASVLSRLGEVYLQMEDYPLAKKYLLRAIEIQEKTLGKQHLETAESYHCIGNVYLAMERYDKALEYFEKDRIACEKNCGQEGKETSRCYFDMGTLYDEMEEYEKALECYNKALTIRIKNGCEKDPTTASIYQSIGFVQWNQDDMLGAIQNLYKAYAILKATVGERDSDTIDCVRNLAHVLNLYSMHGDLNVLDPGVVQFKQKYGNGMFW